MHAVVLRDGEVLFEERPDPVPGDTQVLVAVRAAGLNGADMLQRQGRYPAPQGVAADVPGLETAGEVVAVGGRVTQVAVGDRVMALVGGGGQATMAVVDEAQLIPVPESVEWPEAGGFFEVYATAHDALFTQCGLSVGDRLLVTGGAGGVGVAAVQLGAVAGATVVASVRDPDRHKDVLELGAAEVAGVADIAEHGPYDVVLELVGAACLPHALGALATGARACVIGIGSGATIELDLRILMGNRARIGGATMRARSSAERARVVAAVAAHVVPLLSSGRVRVPVCDTFPMADAALAYDRFAAGSKLGKVVLVNTP